MSRFDEAMQGTASHSILAAMENSPSLHRLPAVLAIVLLLAACSQGVDWSSREKENAAHILTSLRLTSNAAAIANSIQSEHDLDRRNAELLQVLRAAHWNAVQVDDSVLDKLHPQMYARFRMSYQRSLASMLRAYERGDLEGARNAADGIVDFMDWYRSQNHTFRWWDDALQS